MVRGQLDVVDGLLGPLTCSILHSRPREPLARWPKPSTALLSYDENGTVLVAYRLDHSKLVSQRCVPRLAL